MEEQGAGCTNKSHPGPDPLPDINPLPGPDPGPATVLIRGIFPCVARQYGCPSHTPGAAKVLPTAARAWC